MRKAITLITSVTAIVLSLSVSAQNKVPAEQAAKHYGETVTICGTILEDNFIFDTKTKNAFFVLGEGSQNQKVTVVVPAETSKKVIDKPKNYYANKNVCVTGKVVELNGKPEIVVYNQDKIQFGGGGGSEIKVNDFMRFE
jgi:uncharacterized protein YpmB